MKCLPKTCLTLILYSFLAGCNRQDPMPQLLFGKWLWTGSSGGFAGIMVKPNRGERVVLNFSNNGQFSIHQNDTLAYTGIFHIGNERSIYSGKDEPAIELELVNPINNQLVNARYALGGGVIMQLSTSQLSIGDNTYDGFGKSFVRN